jgi:DNA-directed RNA polymerase subunit M/transcription elongation factor TFIIS
MHFCSNCDNMYYLKLASDEGNELIYYCRKCGNEETSIGNESVVVSTTNIKQKEQKFHHIINEYTKYDPTLPRISNIKCPNISCLSNKEKEDPEFKENEIIYMRYDTENMKYVYICSNCDTIWKNDKNI